jgi:hypothetical protein
MVIAVLVEVSRYPIRPLALHRIIMPSASLIPDRQLTFSPELAEIIGLEEAVLLQELGAQLTDRDEWTSLSLESLQRNLSFWSADHIALLIDKLVTLGIVNRAPGDNADTVLLSAAAAASAIQQATAVSPSLTAGASDSLWQPSDALQELLVLNHAIPRSFVDSAKTHFVPTQGSEVDTQFRQYILGRWRDTQRLEARQQPSQAFEIAAPAPFGRDWTPNQDALEILEQAGIDIVFAESVRSEFILYWSERGGPPKEVNSRFVEHVRRRWLKHTSQIQHSTEPTRIPRNWQPDVSVYETLRLAGIDEQDARALLPEFVMYWIDSNEVHTSWNSKFLQHAKRQCRGAGYGDQDGGEKGRGSAGGSHRSKDRSLSDDLTDTSWAN